MINDDEITESINSSFSTYTTSSSLSVSTMAYMDGGGCRKESGERKEIRIAIGLYS